MQCARRQCDTATMHTVIVPKNRTTNSIVHITTTAVEDMLLFLFRASLPHHATWTLLYVPCSNVRAEPATPSHYKKQKNKTMGSILDSTRGESREARSRRRNYVRGLSELNSYVHRLEKDARAWVARLPSVRYAPSAPAGTCVVCMDPLRAGTSCECGCGARCDVVKRLVCCNQDLHYKCLGNFVLQQLSGELFTDTMDEILAWMTMGTDVINPATVLTELSLKRNFMCCPLCRASFLVPPPSLSLKKD